MANDKNSKADTDQKIGQKIDQKIDQKVVSRREAFTKGAAALAAGVTGGSVLLNAGDAQAESVCQGSGSSGVLELRPKTNGQTVGTLVLDDLDVEISFVVSGIEGIDMPTANKTMVYDMGPRPDQNSADHSAWEKQPDSKK